MDFMLIGLMFLATGLAAVGQISMKHGLAEFGTLTIKSMFANLFKVLFQKYIFIGILIYALTTIIYLMALSRAPVSIVYPIVSLSYVFTTVLAMFFLGEKLNVTKWIGMFTIITGVFLIVR